MITVLTNPDEFFRRVERDPPLVGPTAVVTATAVANLLSVTVVMGRVTDVFADTPVAQLAVWLSFVTSILASTFGVFVAWVALSAFAHVVARRWGGRDRQYRDAFKILGWGFSPAIGSGLASGVAAHLVYSRSSFPTEPSQLSAFFVSAQDTPIFVASRALFVLFTVWQGVLWAFAIKNLYDVSLRTATGVVAVPTLFWLGVLYVPTI